MKARGTAGSQFWQVRSGESLAQMRSQQTPAVVQNACMSWSGEADEEQAGSVDPAAVALRGAVAVGERKVALESWLRSTQTSVQVMGLCVQAGSQE